MRMPGHAATTLLTNGARISGQLLKLDLCIPLLITGTGVIQIALTQPVFPRILRRWQRACFPGYHRFLSHNLRTRYQPQVLQLPVLLL